jgi:archaellum biogenesis ATPase FlaH
MESENYNVMEDILREKVNHLEINEEYWKQRSAPEAMVICAVKHSIISQEGDIIIMDWLTKNWSFLSLDARQKIREALNEVYKACEGADLPGPVTMYKWDELLLGLE